MEVIVFGVYVKLSAIISSIGLLLDVAGAVIIYRFGLPENIDRSGTKYIVGVEVDEAEIAMAKFYDRMSFVGISLLVIGFSLQALGNWA